MNRRKIGLVTFVAGTIIFASGLVNEVYNRFTVSSPKNDISIKAVEKNAQNLKYERGPFSVIKECTESKYFPRGLAFAGLSMAVAGYVLRHGNVDISISRYIDFR